MKRETEISTEFAKGANLSYLINELLKEVDNNSIEEHLIEDLKPYSMEEIFTVLNICWETSKDEVHKLLAKIGKLSFYNAFNGFRRGEDISDKEKMLKEGFEELNKAPIESPKIEIIDENEHYKDLKNKIEAELSRKKASEGIETSYQLVDDAKTNMDSNKNVQEELEHPDVNISEMVTTPTNEARDSETASNIETPTIYNPNRLLYVQEDLKKEEGPVQGEHIPSLTKIRKPAGYVPKQEPVLEEIERNTNNPWSSADRVEAGFLTNQETTDKVL